MGDVYFFPQLYLYTARFEPYAMSMYGHKQKFKDYKFLSKNKGDNPFQKSKDMHIPASQCPIRDAGQMTSVALDRMEFMFPFLFNHSSFSLCSNSSLLGFSSKISFCFRIKLISVKVFPKPMSSANIPPRNTKRST